MSLPIFFARPWNCIVRMINGEQRVYEDGQPIATIIEMKMPGGEESNSFATLLEPTARLDQYHGVDTDKWPRLDEVTILTYLVDVVRQRKERNAVRRVIVVKRQK
jgi:hypothetical protein